MKTRSKAPHSMISKGMAGGILIYGANGYTGAHVARQAVKAGLQPRLAGRNGDAVRAIAQELGLDATSFEVTDQAALDAVLKEAIAVLHCAGPYHATSAPMVAACLRTNTHYIDITGEIDVLSAIATRDGDAKEAGIMLLPACGFDTAPGDCLSVRLKERLPESDTLRLALSVPGLVSQGTLRTAMHYIAQGVLIRRNGKLVEQTRDPGRTVDFGNGPVPVLGVNWADVMTAYHSTGIANIEAAFEATRQIKQITGLPRPLKKLFGTRIGQALLARQVKAHPDGPDLAEEFNKQCVLVGEVSNSQTGETRISELRTRGPYWLTAQTTVLAAQKVLAGQAKAGFQTAASAFGSDFILEVDGSAFTDR